MQPFIAFFLVTLTGVFSSTLLKKLHIPWVAALIVGGILMGPSFLDIIQVNETIGFFAQMGLIFLMFMAGLETKLSSFKESSNKLFFLSFVNGFIPFLVGFVLFKYLGFENITALLIGTVFVSSSIAVVVPTLEANNMFKSWVGRSVVTTSMIQDVASLIMLSIILQDIQPVTEFPLYVFYPLLIISLIVFRYLIPKLRDILEGFFSKDDMYQHELGIIFLILIGTVIVFELLGLHSIIGGFFAGLVLSEKVNDEVLKGKLNAISYGFFIPTFFIVVGLTADVGLLSNIQNAIPLVLAIVVGSIAAKFISGYLGARAVKFENLDSLFFGASSIPQLSTTLAVAYTAREFGLISEDVNTALVLLSIISTFLGPSLMIALRKKSFKKNST